jgi:hypothetical protein
LCENCWFCAAAAAAEQHHHHHLVLLQFLAQSTLWLDKGFIDYVKRVVYFCAQQDFVDQCVKIHVGFCAQQTNNTHLLQFLALSTLDWTRELCKIRRLLYWSLRLKLAKVELD